MFIKSSLKEREVETARIGAYEYIPHDKIGHFTSEEIIPHIFISMVKMGMDVSHKAKLYHMIGEKYPGLLWRTVLYHEAYLSGWHERYIIVGVYIYRNAEDKLVFQAYRVPWDKPYTKEKALAHRKHRHDDNYHEWVKSEPEFNPHPRVVSLYDTDSYVESGVNNSDCHFVRHFMNAEDNDGCAEGRILPIMTGIEGREAISLQTDLFSVIYSTILAASCRSSSGFMYGLLKDSPFTVELGEYRKI